MYFRSLYIDTMNYNINFVLQILCNKMKYLLYIILFCSQFIFSQEKKIDSIENVIASIKVDSLKVLEYDKILNKYRNTAPKIHLYFIKKAIENSIEIQNNKQYGSATRELGIFFRKKGQLDSAVINYKKAISIYGNINDSLGVNTVKGSLANALKAKGDYIGAIKNFSDVILFFEKQGEKGHKKALITKFNLGGLYLAMRDWEKADNYFEEVYNQPIIKTNKRMLSSVCINLTVTKTKLKKYKEALKYALIAEGVEKRPRSLANLFNNIGNIYEEKKSFKLADNYYRRSLKIYEKLNSESGIQRSYNNIGNNLIGWKKYSLAEEYLLKSKALLEEGDNIVSLSNNYEMLSALYESKGEFNKSLKYYKKKASINDTLLNRAKLTAIADYESRYKTEKVKIEKEIAEKEVQIAEEKSKKNKNNFIASLLIIGLILLASLFYFSKLKTMKKAELITIELRETQKRLALEKQYKDSELKALKAQMNPHFIFNALNSIQEYIILNKKNLASDYLGRFADLMRTYLDHSNKGKISLYEEVDSLNKYLELENLRFDNTLKYTFKVEEKLNVEDVYIPTMLIQPYVENAIKHGLLHKKENKKIQISFTRKENNIIQCIVEDNGIGREKSQQIQEKNILQHKSFALKATEERLALLNYGNEKKIGVDIIDLTNEKEESNGTRVLLKIPIMENLLNLNI